MLSVVVDQFARIELKRVGIRVAEDGVVGIIPKTTLEEVRRGMDVWHQKVAMAFTHARHARENAEAEDARLLALAEEITAELQA